MNRIYLLIAYEGSFNTFRKRVVKAFYTQENAVRNRDEYNEVLRKLKYKEELKAKRGRDFDHELLYETYDADIEEVEIE